MPPEAAFATQVDCGGGCRLHLKYCTWQPDECLTQALRFHGACLTHGKAYVMMTKEVKRHMTEDSNPSPNLPVQDEELVGLDSPQPIKPKRGWNEIWEKLLRLGLGEIALRAGTGLISIALILLVVWVMGSFYLKGSASNGNPSALAASLPTNTPTVPQPEFLLPTEGVFSQGISRLAVLHTDRPERSRMEISTYTIEKGDTLFGIAEKYGLKPGTILFGNFETMADDPHRIQPGQKLTILPVDGALYKWHAGDGLNGVAKFFNVTPDDIINWEGNKLSRDKLGDLSNPNITPDTMIFIPGGERPFISWSAPLISRKDPAQAKIWGPGFCGVVTDGYVGNGTFVFPTTEHVLSGYDYTPETNHWGLDFAGQLGSPIYATDSGVVVYSGWNDRGYGNVVIIDHGDGWQTLYAHLSQIFTPCGTSVSQGIQIGAMGSTGNSSGPHLHFELMNASGVRVNPWNYLN